jgi:hypothetical protein
MEELVKRLDGIEDCMYSIGQSIDSLAADVAVIREALTDKKIQMGVFTNDRLNRSVLCLVR